MPENERDETQTGADDATRRVNRREFLQIMGASFAALTMAGCKPKAPKEKILPYLQQPEEAIAGQAVWYASTCAGCAAGCGVLVKNRDGRPIKLEGNPDHPLSRGGLCARGQASILDLYDSERLRQPLALGATASWARVDADISADLRRAKSIRIVSRTVTSPSVRAAIEEFSRRHPSARHVVYDPASVWPILEAHRRTHGRAVLPHYRFDRARAIASFGADFLGTWISPVEFARDWATNRKPESESGIMSWHAQFEARMSLTGANADLRVPLKPSQELGTMSALGRILARRLNWSGPLPPHAGGPGADATLIDQVAEVLRAAGKQALVVSASPDPAVHILVNWVNAMLGAYGTTLDIDGPSHQEQGSDPAMAELISEMARGQVDALICLDANPAYEHPRAAEFAAALSKVALSVALSDRRDETASLCRYACPISHALESWGDAQPDFSSASLFQPAIAPLFDSRPALESLLAWSGKPQSAYDFVREQWRLQFFPRSKGARTFSAFWEDAVRKGAISLPRPSGVSVKFDPAALSSVASARGPARAEEFELVAYAGVALADGRQANNPWLQELPDPVTRTCWGNCASFSPQDSERLGIEEGRVVVLSAGTLHAELPAHVQPGQAPGTIAAALGYGRKEIGKIAANYPMVKLLPIERDLLAGADLYPLSTALSVAVALTPRVSPLAKIQEYDFMTDPLSGERRKMVQETTLQDFRKDSASGSHGTPEEGQSLWPRHAYEGHKWGMAVDLNACTGCAGCVVACQAENNVPVVGKAEVRKGRDMHWIRIDRYYVGALDSNAASPETAFQPMLCQHCDNAPCETVCPVLATVHSREGLNMQVYNRCVGTRYCANNCPYKVRRFNWFDYAHQDLVENLALNPDVTVRSRGVMEKCSFCVQRIYSAKFQAKQEGREIKDGDVTPACAYSCPAQAIVFGDLNDPHSRVARIARQTRSYRALTEIGTGPSVFYRTKVRNKKV